MMWDMSGAMVMVMWWQWQDRRNAAVERFSMSIDARLIQRIHLGAVAATTAKHEEFQILHFCRNRNVGIQTNLIANRPHGAHHSVVFTYFFPTATAMAFNRRIKKRQAEPPVTVATNSTASDGTTIAPLVHFQHKHHTLGTHSASIPMNSA